MSRATDPSDLICRARRRELSPEERRQLQELLNGSGEMRLMSVMLSEFERESQVRPGDDVLLARISERALGLTEKAPPRRFRRARSTLLLAAALMLLGSAAWAFRAVYKASVAEAPKVPTASIQPAKAPANRRASPPPPSVPPLPAAGERAPEVPANPLPSETRKPARTLERTPPSVTTQGTRRNAAPKAPFNPASELFARANALRRQGRATDAAALYQLVLDEHPESREAAPARLALAKLLRSSSPARALAHFSALAGQGGALRPEALWGMAEAARSLGNEAMEARALSELLREFPDSPYADAARRRSLDDAR